MSSIGRRLEGSFPPAVAASSSERDPSSNHYLCPQQQHQHQNQQQQRYQHQQQYQQPHYQTHQSQHPPLVVRYQNSSSNITNSGGNSNNNININSGNYNKNNNTDVPVSPRLSSRSRNWSDMTRTIWHYERIEQIGEGTYGQVYRARCKESNEIVALKKIRVHHGAHWGMPPTVIREIKILKRLVHPNLVRMIEVVSSKGVEHLDTDDYHRGSDRSRKSSNKHKQKIGIGGGIGIDGSCDDDDDAGGTNNKSSSRNQNQNQNQTDIVADARESYKGNLFLVLEYVPHDLTGLLDIAYRFNEIEIKCIFKQLLDALNYMHSEKYVHRDIKSSNILIDQNFRLKLADFGLARSIEPPLLDKLHDRGNSQEFTNKVITLWYRPPELLLGATKYGTAVDIWSAGCILAELILGRPLFTGKSEMEQLQLIFDMVGTPTDRSWPGVKELKLLRTGDVTIDGDSNRKRPKLRERYSTKMNNIAPGAINLVEKLLELDPSKRLTASRALNHRYFLQEPRSPDQPEGLGYEMSLAANGSFHEFQTKKKRKEAKVEAEKFKQTALDGGQSSKQAQEEYDAIYRRIMEQVAREGLNVECTTATATATAIINTTTTNSTGGGGGGGDNSQGIAMKDGKLSTSEEVVVDNDADTDFDVDAEKEKERDRSSNSKYRSTKSEGRRSSRSEKDRTREPSSSRGKDRDRERDRRSSSTKEHRNRDRKDREKKKIDGDDDGDGSSSRRDRDRSRKERSSRRGSESDERRKKRRKDTSSGEKDGAERTSTSISRRDQDRDRHHHRDKDKDRRHHREHRKSSSKQDKMNEGGGNDETDKKEDILLKASNANETNKKVTEQASNDEAVSDNIPQKESERGPDDDGEKEKVITETGVLPITTSSTSKDQSNGKHDDKGKSDEKKENSAKVDNDVVKGDAVSGDNDKSEKKTEALPVTKTEERKKEYSIKKSENDRPRSSSHSDKKRSDRSRNKDRDRDRDRGGSDRDRDRGRHHRKRSSTRDDGDRSSSKRRKRKSHKTRSSTPERDGGRLVDDRRRRRNRDNLRQERDPVLHLDHVGNQYPRRDRDMHNQQHEQHHDGDWVGGNNSRMVPRCPSLMMQRGQDFRSHDDFGPYHYNGTSRGDDRGPYRGGDRGDDGSRPSIGVYGPQSGVRNRDMPYPQNAGGPPPDYFGGGNNRGAGGLGGFYGPPGGRSGSGPGQNLHLPPGHRGRDDRGDGRRDRKNRY